MTIQGLKPTKVLRISCRKIANPKLRLRFSKRKVKRDNYLIVFLVHLITPGPSDYNTDIDIVTKHTLFKESQGTTFSVSKKQSMFKAMGSKYNFYNNLQ